MKISSGLGEAPPANLVVLPILFEDQVLGVIELASFTSFTPVQTDFLEQLTETIGVNVNTIIANARTDALLEESQRLTAELQARSEELQSQQDELQRSNAELEEKAALLAAQNRDIETKNAEIEQARQEIEERAQQLALASKYKSEFLANMSHELRTPLNSLLILARLLAQNPGRNLTAKQVEYANVIHSAGSDLLQLINDILDLSKVEAGRMDIHAERFPLSALLEDVQATFQPLTAEKGLDFSVEADTEAPAELVTDRQRLRQVLRNLLSNAVKFTERGHVLLRVARSGRDADSDMLAFSVADTGIGIAPDNLTTIFGAFQQGDGTPSRRYGGTGLGLSIAREVGALLGGEITAESELGQGSTFTLYLPCELPGGIADAADPGSDGLGRRVQRRGARRGDRGAAAAARRARRHGARRPAAAGPRGGPRRPADPAGAQRGLRPDRHPRPGPRGHGGQPGTGHRGPQRGAAPVRGARPRAGGRVRVRLPGAPQGRSGPAGCPGARAHQAQDRQRPGPAGPAAIRRAPARAAALARRAARADHAAPVGRAARSGARADQRAVPASRPGPRGRPRGTRRCGAGGSW